MNLMLMVSVSVFESFTMTIWVPSFQIGYKQTTISFVNELIL